MRLGRAVFILALVSLTLAGAREQASSSVAAAYAPGRAAGRARVLAPAQVIGAQCIDCHPAVVRSYRESGMARALGPLRRDELAGLEPLAVKGSGYEYRYEISGAVPALVESWRAPGSTDAASPVREAAIAFAVGAGIVDRSYVAVYADRMWFAPVEVLTGATFSGPAHDPRAVLAPGHQIQPGLRLDSPIAPACLACHTDSLPPATYPENLRPADADWRPRGISCAGCHGDGDGHVAWRVAELEGELDSDAGPDPILGLVGSDPLERLSVCARCHLQGDARIRLARDGSSYVEPGGDLLDEMAIFVAAESTSDIGFVSQTERMVLSRCFTESVGTQRPLDCQSCHDPHRSLARGPDAGRERQRVRAGCLGCHPAGYAAEAQRSANCSMPLAERGARDCVDCHMRRTSVFDLPEVEVHDHFVQADPGPPSSYDGPPRLSETRDGRVRLFTWPLQDPPAYADDSGLAMMAAIKVANEQVALALVDAPTGPGSKRLPAYHHLRGILLERLGRLDEARKSYLRALILDPEAAESTVNLALVSARTGSSPEKRMAELDALLERHPRAEAALRNRAVLRSVQGDQAGFVRDLERAQALFPRAENARALASYYRSIGDSLRAETWRAEAGALDPAGGKK